jgi:23S rRNA (cytosine1962-C5)-methyltransferase
MPEVAGLENGLTYLIRPGAGLSVGLFLDLRDVRERLRERTRERTRGWAGGRTVLNAFSYTCVFGVAALAGGSTRVLNLDLSRAALAWGQDNYRANGLTPDPYDFVYGDVFDWLGRLARRNQTFDLVILDPPGFSRSQERTFQAARDYGDLVTLAARVLSPHGRLLACCNLAELPLPAFRRQVLAGLTAAGRRGRVAGAYHEPEVDFPVAPGQSPYLKVLAIET